LVVEPYLGLADELYDSLLKLNGEERDAWILTELRGLTVREAADVLGTSFKTIHRRAEAARNYMQKELAA